MKGLEQGQFVSSARARLRDWNADLVELRARLELADGPPRGDVQERIDAFLSHQKLAEVTLDRIAKVEPEGWAQRGSVFQKAWAALEKRLDDVTQA